MNGTSDAATGDDSLLRDATLDDLPDLMRLTREFYDEDGFTTTDAELDRNFRALVASTSAHTCLALHAGDSIGFALTTSRMILESGVVAELQDLYVMPAHRRRHVATRLVRDAVRWAQEQQAALLEVVIAPNGRDVSHLFTYYAALGFRDDGRRLLSLNLNRVA